MDTDDFYSKRRPPPRQRQDSNPQRPLRSPYRASREQDSSQQQQPQQRDVYNDASSSVTSTPAARMSPYAPPVRGTRESSTSNRSGAGTYRGGQREGGGGGTARQYTGRPQLRVDPTSASSNAVSRTEASSATSPESVVSSKSAPVRVPPRRKPPPSPGGSDAPYADGSTDGNRLPSRVSSVSSQRYNRSQSPYINGNEYEGNPEIGGIKEEPDEEYEAKMQVRKDAMAALEGRTPEPATATSNENFMQSLFKEAGFGSENGDRRSRGTNGGRNNSDAQGDDRDMERSANVGASTPTDEVQNLFRRYPILSDHVARISRTHKNEIDRTITQHDSETRQLKRQHGEMLQTLSSKLNKLSLLAKENEKRLTETERNKRVKILALVAEELGMDIGEEDRSVSDDGLFERILDTVRSVSNAEKQAQKEKQAALREVEALDEALIKERRNRSSGGTEATEQALMDSERERKLLEEDLAAAEVNLGEAVEAIKVGAVRERELREKVKLLEASGSPQGGDANALRTQIQDLKAENRNYATTMGSMRDECMKLLTELERKCASEKKRRIELEAELNAERQKERKESSESEISISNVAPSANEGKDLEVARKRIEELEEFEQVARKRLGELEEIEQKLRSDFEKEVEAGERKAEDNEFEMERLKKQNAVVKQTVDDLETDIRDLTSDRNRMMQTISDLRGEREELEGELRKYRDESSVITSIAPSADHVKELESTRSRTEELEEVMKAEQTLRNDLEEELLERREKAANNEFELERLRKQKSEVEQRVEDLEAVILDMEGERDRMKQMVSNLRVERQEFEAGLEAATYKFKAETERMRAHRGERDPKATEKELNMVTRERDGFRDRMLSLETEKLNLEERIEALERTLTSANRGAGEENEENTQVSRYNTQPDNTTDARSVSILKDAIKNLELQLSDTQRQLEDLRENLGDVEMERSSWQTKADLCKELLERTVREQEKAKRRVVELESELEVVTRASRTNMAEGERGAEEEKERAIAEWKKKSEDREQELERTLETLRKVQESFEEEMASQSSDAQAKLDEIRGSLVEAEKEKVEWRDKGEIFKEELQRTVRQREETKLRVDELERELSEAKLEMRRNMEEGEREADEKKENAINFWKIKAEESKQELELERERSLQRLQQAQKDQQDAISLQSSDAQARLDEMRGNLEELEKEKAAWQSKFEAVAAELEATVQERQQKDRRLEELENDLRDAVSDKKLLQSKLEERESELEKVVQEREKSRGRMEELETELEDARNNIQTNMENGKREAGEKESAIASWKKKADDSLQELESERGRSMQSLQRLQERYEEEIDGLHQQLEKVKKTVAENLRQLEETVNQKREITQREEEAIKQLEIVTKQRADAVKEVQDSKKQAQSLEKELAEIGSSTEATMAEHRTKAEKLESRVSELELLLAQERITSASAREALENYSSELINLKTSVAEEDDAHRQALASRDSSLKSLTSKLSASEASITELKAERTKLEASLKKEAQAREVEFQARMSETEKSFKSQIAGLNTRLEEATRLLNSSEGKISGVERQMDVMKRELSVVKARAAEAEAQVDETNMEKAVIDGKYRKVERRLAQVEGECDLKIAGYEEKLRIAEEEADRVLAKNMDMMVRLAVYE